MGVVTGVFQYTNGSPVANASYQWKLSNDAILFSGTAACVVPPIVAGSLDANGNLTTTFAFNDVLSTTAGATTYYQLTVKAQNGGQVWNESYYLTGTAANLNLIPPAGIPIIVTTPVSSVLLQTNNVTNANQVKLNLLNGAGASFAADSAGGVTVSANLIAGLNMAFSTVANAVTINGADIVPGTNITTSTSTANAITVNAGGGANLAAQPSYLLSGDGQPFPYSSQLGQFGTGVINQVKAWLIRLPYTIVFAKASFRLNQSGPNPSLIALGVYDVNKNKLFSWDNINSFVGSPTNFSSTFAAVTLTPGMYWTACGGNYTSTGAASESGYSIQSSSLVVQNSPFGTRLGTAANALVSGAMPSSLGSITANNLGTFPAWCMEP